MYLSATFLWKYGPKEVYLYQRNEANMLQPLAERLRPKTLDEYIGQEHILGKGRLLRRAIQADQLSSVIFSSWFSCSLLSIRLKPTARRYSCTDFHLLRIKWCELSTFPRTFPQMWITRRLFLLYGGMLLFDNGLAAHVRLQNLRNPYASVRLQIILQERDQHSGRSDYRII